MANAEAIAFFMHQPGDDMSMIVPETCEKIRRRSPSSIIENAQPQQQQQQQQEVPALASSPAEAVARPTLSASSQSTKTEPVRDDGGGGGGGDDNDDVMWVPKDEAELSRVMEQGCRATFHKYIIKLANGINSEIGKRVIFAQQRDDYVERNVVGIGQDARFLALAFADRIISNIKTWTSLATYARNHAGILVLMQTALFVASKLSDIIGATSAKLINPKMWKVIIQCERLLMEAMNYELTITPPSVAAYDAIREFFARRGGDGTEEHIRRACNIANAVLAYYVVDYPLRERVLTPGWDVDWEQRSRPEYVRILGRGRPCRKSSRFRGCTIFSPSRRYPSFVSTKHFTTGISNIPFLLLLHHASKL